MRHIDTMTRLSRAAIDPRLNDAERAVLLRVECGANVADAHPRFGDGPALRRLQAVGYLSGGAEWLDRPDVYPLGATMKQRGRLARIAQYHGSGCAYCRAEADCVEHVVPRARGGGDDWGNVAPSCAACNNRKGTKTAEEFLIAEPARWRSMQAHLAYARYEESEISEDEYRSITDGLQEGEAA